MNLTVLYFPSLSVNTKARKGAEFSFTFTFPMSQFPNSREIPNNGQALSSTLQGMLCYVLPLTKNRKQECGKINHVLKAIATLPKWLSSY